MSGTRIEYSTTSWLLTCNTRFKQRRSTLIAAANYFRKDIRLSR